MQHRLRAMSAPPPPIALRGIHNLLYLLECPTGTLSSLGQLSTNLFSLFAYEGKPIRYWMRVPPIYVSKRRQQTTDR